MKILVDTDVLLDVALARQEFLAPSAAVVTWAETHPGHAAVAWHSLANLAYLIRPDPRAFLLEILDFADVPRTDARTARAALKLPMADVEDALQAAAALAFGADFIVTRNTRDYRSSPVPALTPAEFLAHHGGQTLA